MRRIASLLTLGFMAGIILAGQNASADTVFMADGRILHGKVTETPDGIILKTRIGTISFPENAVTSWKKDDTDSAAPTTVAAEVPTTQAAPATQPSAPVAKAPTKAPKKAKLAKGSAATQPVVAAAATRPTIAKAPVATEPTVAAATPAVATTQPGGADQSIPEAKKKFEPDIRSLLAARWNALGSLVAIGDEQVTGDQTGNWHIVFRFFGDRAYWERTPEAVGSATAPSGDRLVRSLLPDRVILMANGGVAMQKPSVDTFQIDDDLDIALGLRAPLETAFLTPDSLDLWKMKFPNSDSAALTLSITPPDGTKTNRLLTLSRPMKYAFKDILVSRNGMSIEHITCDGFQDVGGWKLPTHISVEMFGDDGQPTHKTLISIASFKLNDPKNTPDTYSDFWPAGTPVNDQSQK